MWLALGQLHLPIAKVESDHSSVSRKHYSATITCLSSGPLRFAATTTRNIAVLLQTIKTSYRCCKPAESSIHRTFSYPDPVPVPSCLPTISPTAFTRLRSPRTRLSRLPKHSKAQARVRRCLPSSEMASRRFM